MPEIHVVNFCDPAQQPTNPDEVVFCDPAQKPAAPEEVRFCDPKTGNCPSDTEPLAITGTDTPNNGSTYSVTGGIGPFTWSVTGGATLTVTGPRSVTITNVSGHCGAGTITVSDMQCSTTKTKDIRYPVGQWVLIADEWGNPCGLAVAEAQQTCTRYEGKHRWDYRWANQQAYYPSQIGCAGCYNLNKLLAHPCTGAGLAFVCQSGGWDQAYVKYSAEKYEWKCP